MKKSGLMMVCVVVVAVSVQAEVITAEWDSWNGALDAEWDSFGDLTAVMPADELTSDPQIVAMVADGYLFYSDENQVEYGPDEMPWLYDFYGQGADERTNVLELTDDFQLFFELDNYPGGIYKELLLSVTYYDQGVESEVVAVDQSEGTSVSGINFLGWEIDGIWVTDTWQIIYEPNPAWEAVAVNFNGFPGSDDYPARIDSVYIETECIPEPATMGLFALGAVFGLRRKRA